MDATYIILRPRTMKSQGGDLNYLYRPYNTYVTVDRRYEDLKDDFVKGVSWMNLAEVALNFFAIAMHIKNKAGLAVLLAFMVSAMTLAKTVLYFLVSTPLCSLQHFVNYSDLTRLIFLYIIPNGIWIVVPLLCMVATGRMMVDCMESDETNSKEEVSLKKHTTTLCIPF
ncbi:hypothetical protein OS493_033606 [Desmophyllum pertusum]|uniref:Uncharacterized protein n=1 Tax=Desmophyllum pertusum TaxID=174260 RepID=A0A9X0CNW4_9CNID|nr:hypothetical protein OS493_033606 [Desmophyllum pertusum]